MLGDAPLSMSQLVRELIVSYLTEHPNCQSGEAWQRIAAAASGRMMEPVTAPFVAGIFWGMHHEGLVDYSGRGTVCLKPKT